MDMCLLAVFSGHVFLRGMYLVLRLA